MQVVYTQPFPCKISFIFNEITLPVIDINFGSQQNTIACKDNGI